MGMDYNAIANSDFANRKIHLLLEMNNSSERKTFETFQILQNAFLKLCCKIIIFVFAC